MPGQASITEAIYDILIYHAAIRLAPFVEMVTHSATVNLGGGLRKERERVWANPCHYAQGAFAAFGGATPVVTEIESAVERAPLVLPDLRSATTKASYSAIDALAALDKDGALLISLVHRGTAGPIRVAIQFDDFKPAATAELHILTADAPWQANSMNQPDRVQPTTRAVPVTEGAVELDIPPYSVLRLRTARQ
jgi:alpha-N-arabinofuranosidase